MTKKPLFEFNMVCTVKTNIFSSICSCLSCVKSKKQ